ncbi:MAG: NAD(P)/FAD-dependent oxidoreductase [bacterium]
MKTHPNRLHIGIIGAGAAGLMAGIAAARAGYRVTIYERNEKAGRKILVTGNGRCNITNQNVSWKNYHGKHAKFAASVLAEFSNYETIAFFEKLGLALVEEDRGRMFPATQKAQSVIDVLLKELEHLGVEIFYNKKIQKIKKNVSGFQLEAIPKKEYLVDRLIIATGGKSYAILGSTGDGYRFAENFGHHLVDLFPASTPFRISSKICNSLMGIKVDVALKIFNNKNKVIAKNSGEMMFTHLGISAPVVLEMSRDVSRFLYLEENAALTCSINFFPDLSQDELIALMYQRTANNPERNLGSIFHELLPKKLVATILEAFDFDPLLKNTQVSKKMLNRIAIIFTDYRERIEKILGWDSAQFTAGGVDTTEIDSETMQSRLVPGLFFAGEVVDIDGDSGGFNLQWAWSSGWVAGRSAGVRERRANGEERISSSSHLASRISEMGTTKDLTTK